MIILYDRTSQTARLAIALPPRPFLPLNCSILQDPDHRRGEMDQGRASSTPTSR